MIFTSKLIAALATLTVSLAGPILQARSCKPDFQGQPLTIYKTIPGEIGQLREWTSVDAVGSHITLARTTVNQAFANGEFFVESTGLPDNSYHLKMTADTARTLQLAGALNGDLSFASITWSGTSQNFAIDCSSCSSSSPDVGISCFISHPATGTCVTGNSDGATLALVPCDGTFAQDFNFRA